MKELRKNAQTSFNLCTYKNLFMYLLIYNLTLLEIVEEHTHPSGMIHICYIRVDNSSIMTFDLRDFENAVCMAVC